MRTQPSSPRRVLVLTGATDGIGKATALRLGRDGWHVVVVGRNPQRCADTVAAITGMGGSAEAAVGDLSGMADVRAIADRIAAGHDRLDALVLNANTITQDRRLTVDGFEANLAVGLLGRALLHWRLAPLLAATPRSQVLTVVGLDHQRLDLADPHLAQGYTAWAALKRWQWAVQVHAQEANRRGGPPVNVYMPGLVKTKILANEPQPMRVIVQLANLVIGLPVERAGDEMATVIERVAAEGIRDAWFSRTTRKPMRDVKAMPGDGPAVWAWAEATLRPWLG